MKKNYRKEDANAFENDFLEVLSRMKLSSITDVMSDCHSAYLLKKKICSLEKNETISVDFSTIFEVVKEKNTIFAM